MNADPLPAPFRILTVCTGNICRSPFAERALQAAFDRLAAQTGDPAWPVEVASAGTHAMVGRPIEPQMADRAAPYGIDPDGHHARSLDAGLVDRADLLLAMARRHRRDIVRLLPRASGRTFTLAEFARLLEDAAAAGLVEPWTRGPVRDALAATVLAAAGRRGFATAPDDPDDDDVLDPYGGGAADYDLAAERIAGTVGRIERVLADRVIGSGR